jgi:hypothetical protein
MDVSARNLIARAPAKPRGRATSAPSSGGLASPPENKALHDGHRAIWIQEFEPGQSGSKDRTSSAAVLSTHVGGGFVGTYLGRYARLDEGRAE